MSRKAAFSTTLFTLFVLLVSSCTPSVPPEAYPTYDPFAPVNSAEGVSASAQGGGTLPDRVIPSGPTPTRAPISVIVHEHDSNAIFGTPTPDPPHAIPSPRQLVDTYTVEAGDTLGSIAQGYGISLNSLLEANGLNESSVLTIGMTLDIPPVDTGTIPGSSFKMIPDSELVYSPAAMDFDIEAYIQSQNGYLANYIQDVNGETLSGAQIIERISENYSINPRLLLALLEYRSQWVTNPAPSNVDYPLGFYDDYYAGLYRQAAWAANNLNRGYYLWRVNALSSLPLSDGTYVPMDPTINAGTAGLQYFLSQYNNRPIWDLDVSEFGFFLTYNMLFGSPYSYQIISPQSSNLTQPPMQLPIERGTVWSYTGGPHGGWDWGSAWAALDFAPPGEGGGCAPDTAWVVAVADGPIVRAEDGAVVQDLDNDGYEQTGWTVLYMHIDSFERVEEGTYVYAGEKIGHPSCEGGVSNATHLHLARRYNGEWIPADGSTPFILDGWVSSGNGVEYDGKLTRGTTVIEAWEGVHEGLNQISR
ncbi:MAG TPA: LysM peptidoglycan-binding domain-containing protein [Anaerolineales bacterium]|nr:LysM peptidoglycan-binding domain-containing protein [Anaerolineales bacterium]